MQYYTANVNGNLAFYCDVVHGENIPIDAIAITEDTWRDAIANPGKYSIQAGQFVAVSSWPPIQTTEELLTAIRRKRDALLAACDWTQLPDSPLTVEIQNEWKVYRQALRDMLQMCDPYNLVWPVVPE